MSCLCGGMLACRINFRQTGFSSPRFSPCLFGRLIGRRRDWTLCRMRFSTCSSISGPRKRRFAITPSLHCTHDSAALRFEPFACSTHAICREYHDLRSQCRRRSAILVLNPSLISCFRTFFSRVCSLSSRSSMPLGGMAGLSSTLRKQTNRER